ncbi:scavenger receptor cysteine-rich domain-containing protein DMBT1-like [Antedon mediterranea]|uniref:scavenger receptor cysteine-rich domain-containing protein DMBT1-like n=1 Tax=Antedon mediterranea TaxID=105859 RepID=UPI003AF8A4B4
MFRFCFLLLFVCFVKVVVSQEAELTRCERYHELVNYLSGVPQLVHQAEQVQEEREQGANENEIEENENIGQTGENVEIVEVAEPTILTMRDGVTASQSSEGWSGVASRAIDGNRNGVYGGHSCTHTQNSGTSWWKVDLTETNDVVFVRIFNRNSYGERLESAVVRVGDNENADANDPCGSPVTTIDVRNGPVIDKYCAAGTRGRYVSVHVANYLTLCEVEVYDAELLSQGRLAIQSSEGWSGVASRAVDASHSGNYNHNTCTHTQRQPQNWWKLDLGNSYSVRHVRIYNRQDCCRERLAGAIVRVGDDEGMTSNPQCGEPVTPEETTASSIVDRQCDPALDGQYVSISLENNYLTLCEVEVWGDGDMSRPVVSESPSGLLSAGKPTAQSSLGWQGLSMRAVDGDYGARYNQRTCTHTQNDNPSWWRVDLGQSLTVRYVRIRNRADCCSNRLNTAQVRVGDNEDVMSNAACGEAFTMEDITNVPSPDRICNGDEGLQGRYVSVNVNNYLTLCEVEVYDGVLLTGGTATQSSYGWSGEAARAIDGNRNHLYGGNSCTHTQNEANSWWKVDLLETFDITSVTIFNRADCCTDRIVGAIVRVSREEDSQSGEQCGEPVSSIDVSRSPRIVRKCTLNGQYVSVTVSNYLTLCEVEVFGTPDADTIAAREAAAAEAARLLAEAERAAEEARQRAEAEALAEAQRVIEETRGIRLVGGSSESEGRVEIFINNAWGTVCDDYWDLFDASVACRQMGFTAGALEAPMRARFGQGEVEIFLDDVACTNAPSETALVGCSNSGVGTHNCAHSEDAGVVCNTGEPESAPSVPIRLVGGNGDSEGRVEVYVNGFWGTVCDDSWDINDANVVCRQVGFEHGAQDAPMRAHFGQGELPILLDDIVCSGAETAFLACGNAGIGRHNCAHSEDASVICNTMAPAPDVLVRLVGSESESEGRVEVWSEGRWGTVCDDYWDFEDGQVVCHQLGFVGGAREAPMSARFGAGSGDIILDDVACTGSESNIFDCTSITRHNCGHHEDASVICHSNEGSEGNVRLIGGSNEYEGRVEIFTQGRWGTVCDDAWDTNDASVVCRQLGFGRASEAPPQARFGQGRADILLDNVGCSGPETSLISCSNIGIGVHNCAHSEDASVICTGPHPNSEIRLVGGTDGAGRVEINVDGEWGTICDDYWTLEDAQVVCRQLGLPGGATSAPGSAAFGQGTGPILYDDVRCTGTEEDIAHCPNIGIRVHNCGHHEDASVVCGAMSFEVRLVGGFSSSEGRVEVLLGGNWGTVCDDSWDLNDAQVVCRQLELPAATSAPQRAHFGQGSGPILLDDVACTASEQNIGACRNSGLRRHNCGHHEDASVVCGTTSSEIRLVGGSDNNEGRVEIRYENEWGTICDDLWDLDDAQVVCRQLGLPEASQAPGSARFGQGTGTIVFDDVQCAGTEGDILHCTNRGTAIHNCHHQEDAGVICRETTSELRLVGGSSNNEGRVEVNIGNGWGTICDDGWDLQDAQVVCRQLGLPAATSAPIRANFGQGSGSILLDDVVCTGTEEDIIECGHRGIGSHNCGHYEDASVVCGQPTLTSELRLVGGSSSNEGRVEVNIGNGWGTICDDGWGLQDAQVVCRQLGLPAATSAPIRANFGQGSGSILLDDVVCTGTEEDIIQCGHGGIGNHNCGHHEDASVVCGTTSTGCGGGNIRLVGGGGSNEGRVEVNANGQWGTICDDLWDINDAHVVCGQLGLGRAREAPQRARFGQGSGNIYYDNVQCGGQETDVTSCTSNGLGSHNCAHSEDASVICTGGSGGNIRLVGGSGSNEGRVEVNANGQWGTICDDLWDINDAHVVCGQLGLGRAREAPQRARFGQGSGNIYYDNVQCGGQETDVTSCTSNGLGSHNCAHSEDASVICTGGGSSCGGVNIRIVGGGSSNEGRVEVNANGQWGTICDDLWDINDAHVVCGQLGLGRAREAPQRARFGQGSGNIYYDNVQCGGQETDVTSCTSNGLGSHNCAHSEDASVICTGAGR